MTPQTTKATAQNGRPYEMDFDIATIKHLGLQMYSTLPPVIGELVANAWDANATEVEITIPETRIDDRSEIIIKDNGDGMSDSDLREKYLIVGRDRRESEDTERPPAPDERPIMGRKGIGKFSAFGIAKEIEIESAGGNGVSCFVMDYDEMLKSAPRRRAEFPSLKPTGNVSQGTTITLRRITKFRTRPIPLAQLRRGLARRFSIIGEQHQFEVIINGDPISVEERDLTRLLAKDADGKPYLWEFNKVKIDPDRDWAVTGWIGALERTTGAADGVERGISILARGKLVQEPFLFKTVAGQQYALSYLVGELHAEFVDNKDEDTIGTSRNVLVWDTDANTKLLEWGQQQVKDIAREWATKRQKDNVRKLEENELYQKFKERAKEIDNQRAWSLADKLVRQAISKNPTADVNKLEPIIQTSLDFMEFDAFGKIAQDLVDSDVEDVEKLLSLFKEWEIVEAKEMARVTEGRIKTIEKLQDLIEKDTLEVQLHNLLKDFPWVIDPRWTLVDDEVSYSKLLKEKFPDDELDEKDRRIDFLCVRESGDLVVVEIKRPKKMASKNDLEQIENYVSFVRHREEQTTDPKQVVGYLLCGGLVDTWEVRQKRKNLEKTEVYVRPYSDLLRMVRKMHKEFLDRYEQLRKRAKG